MSKGALATESTGADQSATSQESDSGAEKFDAKSHFLGKLAEERGESSADDQPSNTKDNGDDDEESSGQQDDAGDEASDGDDADQEESGDSDQSDDGGDEDDDQPDGDEDSTQSLTVNDRQYTAADITALEKKTSDLEKGYRQSTQQMSELRKEYKEETDALETIGAFFSNLTTANVKSLENMDLSQMDADQIQAWKNQLGSTKQGSAEIKQKIGELLKGVEAAKEKMKSHAATESVAVLKSSEPRWNDKFYAEVRDYAVGTGRYSAEEFSEVTDWRQIEGMIALMDAAAVKKIGKSSTDKDGKSKTVDKSKPKRRRQNQKAQRRNAQGKFESSRGEALKSRNARGDGSLRSMLQDRLAAERTGRR